MAGPELAVCDDDGPGKISARIDVAGARITADEPIEHGGGGTGPSPHQLLAAALSACTAMTLRLYADRKGWPLAHAHVEVEHRREEGVAPQDLFFRRVRLEGPLDPAQKERLIEIAQRCPVHRTLVAGSRIETVEAAEGLAG
ncbi:MAG TPA: OsmC family protein [Caulobacteraceae bacterium]|nr:OsmC family protein [Caulobacteraceae bacterium]